MKSLLTIALVIISLSVSAQSARLQVIHNSPEPTVDVYVNTGIFLDDFEFRTATEFVDVASGIPLTLDVAPSNSTSAADAIYSITVTLDDGETYVAIASGIVGDATTPFEILLTDGVRESAAGSGIDFIGIHGSPDAPTVDITARGVATLLDDVSYRDISGYINVPAGPYTLDVTPGADPSTIVASFSADLTTLDGKSAVVFASGFLGMEPAFGLYAAFADGTVRALPSVPTATGVTQLQIIHNAAMPTVDVYLNGTLAVDNFTYRSATPFIDVPADVPVLIQIAPSTSSSAAEALTTYSGIFRSDRDYVAIATGVVGDPSAPLHIAFQGNVRQSNTSGEVQFLVYHGATDAPTIDVVNTAFGGPITVVDDLSYSEIHRYIQLPALPYILEIRLADGVTPVAAYLADLSGLANGNAIVFASGLLAGSPDFGLFAALPDGTVVEFASVPGRAAGPQIEATVFPTMTQSEIYVNLNSYEGVNDMSIEVVDLTGKVLKSNIYNATQGADTHRIDVSDLTPGTYYVVVRAGETTDSTPFVRMD